MGSTTSYLAFIIRNLFFDFEFREVLLTNRKYSHESYLQLDNIIEEPDKKRYSYKQKEQSFTKR